MQLNRIKLCRNAGFTLLELMIAMIVGLFLLGGVMFTYLSMKVTTNDTIEMGELQETGRIALDILGKDIAMTGFFGRLNTRSLFSSEIAASAVAGADCESGVNNASFPDDTTGTNFRVLFGVVAQNASVLNCITNAEVNSDVIQIKRSLGQDVSGEATLANQYYVETTLDNARFVDGGTPAIDVDGTGVWGYAHHVYYVSEQTYQSNGKDVTVPVLMRKRLTRTGGMETEPVLEGVENIRFLYGLDIDGSGTVDVYRDASQMTTSDWEQSGTTAIRTVQVAVLVRATKEDANMNLVNQTYILGGDTDASQRKLTFTDNYRRMVFTSTFKINNSGSTQWSIAI
ncbi:PilW family protein [Pseudoalteromonas pernae]|uniref:PilW family protein n=1 Tax=Pseudoalteromonas pernae TaxID=3118054 RepID=UPI003242F096